MTKERNMHKILHSKGLKLFATVCFTVMFGVPSSYANNPDSIRGLAKNFLEKLSPVYDGNQNKNTEAEAIADSFDQVPDGATLLLRPRSQRVMFVDDIYALKKNDDVYVVLEDVINILEFAVDFRNDGNSAEGWFLREDWNFSFDRETGKVNARDVEHDINPDDLYDDGGLLFVRGDALAKWLGIEFEYDVSQQFLDITSPYPLPAVSRLMREKRAGRNTKNPERNKAQLPRQEHDRRLFKINTADVTIGQNYQRNTNGKGTSTQTLNVAAEGEVLKHGAYVLVNADSTNNLNSVVSRLSQQSENNDLLGPLKARAYSVGDINVTNIPLTGNVTQDLGFRFDNLPLDNVDFSVTDIQGDAIPGWDIELYRNDILVETQRIDQNGRYLFDDIRLFLGNNTFELFFYGPQGEIRKEEISIPVSSEILNAQNNTYEVSVSLEETQTFQKQVANDIDRETPHIAARYNRTIGDGNLGYVGFRSREIEGDRRSYLSTGVSSIIGNTFVDTNFAVDNDTNMSGEIIARRNIADWDLSLRAQANSDEFIINNTEDPEVLNVSANAQRRFTNFFGLRGNVLANAVYRETANGASNETANFGISNNLFGASFSNRLRYQKNTTAEDNTDFSTVGLENFISPNRGDERLDHTFSVRKNIGKTFLRFGTTYGIKPEKELDRIVAQANYLHSSDFSTDVTLERQVQSELDTLRINANYTNDKFRTSPFIRYDSDRQLLAGVNVNFNISDTPSSILPTITNRRLTNRGMISAFVFHDKNGNLTFDDGDEPIEDAIVESLNFGRKAKTDKKGYGLLKEMGTTKATDVVLDRNSLPDPFMIPGTKGKSVFPRAGSMIEMDFPVHMSGEVEGNTLYRDDDNTLKPLPFVQLELLSLDNPEREPITTRSGNDGFHLSFLVPPGRYLVVSQGKESGKGSFGNPLPQIADIGYEGTIVKDVNIEMVEAGSNVPYSVDFSSTPKTTGVDRYLKVKKGGKSELSQLLTQVVKKRFARSILQRLNRIDPSDLATDSNTYDYFYSNDPELLHQSCSDLAKNNMECEIVITANTNKYG